MLILDPNQLVKMTGWDLLRSVGIMQDGSWQHNDQRTFQTTAGHTWHTYTTGGRGKYAGKTYVHLWRECTLKIVLPDGTDTGQRVTDVLHVRGKASERIGTMAEVR